MANYSAEGSEGLAETEPGRILVARPGRYEFLPFKPAEYSFSVIGDPRENITAFAKALETSRHALFAMVLGDLADRGDRDHLLEVLEIAKKSPIPVYFAVGNHDLQGGGRKHYRELFGDEDYSFRIGRDVFAVIDNGADYPRLGRNRIAAADTALSFEDRENSFLLMHMPPVDPRPGEDHHMQCVPLKNELERLVSKRKPTLILAAHIHQHLCAGFAGSEVVVAGAAGRRSAEASAPGYVSVSVTGSKVLWEYKGP